MTAVTGAFGREGIRPPAGGRYWHVSTIRGIVDDEIYLTRTHEQIQELSERGFLSREVLSRLGADKEDSVYWFNRSRVKRIYTDARVLV